MDMYCYQCEQTTGGRSCSTVGLCGKDYRCAGLQDIIVQQVKVLAWYLHHNHLPEGDCIELIIDSLFATITNVNFDENRLSDIVLLLDGQIKKVKGGLSSPCGDVIIENQNITDLLGQAQYYTLAVRRGRFGDTVAGLQELILYGLKGVSSYASGSRELSCVNEQIYSGVIEVLSFLATEPTDIDQLVIMALRVGELNY